MTVNDFFRQDNPNNDSEQLEHQLQIQKTALESSTHGVAVTDAQGRIVWVNPSFTRITGYTAQEASGQTFRLLKSGQQDEAFYSQLWATIRAGKIWHGEIINRRKNGELFAEEQTITPVMDAAGEITHFVAIMQDISLRKQRELEMEAVIHAASSLRTASSRVEMLPAVLEQARKIVNASGAALALPELASGELVFQLGAGSLQVWDGARLGIVEGISGQVLARGEPVTFRSLGRDSAASPVERIAGETAGACLPLIADNQTIGVLWVTRPSPFQVREMDKLSALADISANAIRRASLQEQTDQRLHRLAALRAVDEAISSSLDLSITLGVLLDQVLWQLNVHATDVLLINPHTAMLEAAAARGFLNGARLIPPGQIGEGAAGKAALTRRTVHIPNPAASRESFPDYEAIAAEGFQTYFAVPLIARGEVKGVLEIYHRDSLHPDNDWMNFMEAIAKQAAIAIENAMLFENLQRSNEKIAQAYDATLAGWVRTLGLRDGETEDHTRRVTETTVRLARAVGIAGEELEFIRRGALLHDIGKMGIPDSILRKSGPLTGEEREVIRMHPVYAFELLKPIPYLRGALDIPYCHHERWDGRGYPRRLLKEEIPLSARLFSIADVWDALVSDRPYRRAWRQEQAHEYLLRQAGRQFDPRVVRLFFNTITR